MKQETDPSQRSYSWGEMADLTHETQVAIFNWCSCEDNEGNENPYSDCPTEDGVIGIALDAGGLVCFQCANEPRNKGASSQPAYEVGYPDGYTCAECGDEWYPLGYIKGEEE